jgi:DNA-binding FadR family transcriptional regulator
MRPLGASGDPDKRHSNLVVSPPVRSGSPKAAQIVADLRRQIVRGDLRGDDSLPPEDELMRQYGVSRPTLREALRVLEFDGLLTVRRGAKGGATVHVPTGETAARSMGLVLEHRGATRADVIAARCVIEPACARLVAERGEMADLHRLKQNLTSSDRMGSSAAQHTDFHDLLVDLADNQTLTLMHRMLNFVLQGSTVDGQSIGCTGTRDLDGRRVHEAHHHVVDLIETKDGDRAEEFWTDHLRDCYVALRPQGETPLDFSA